MEKEKPEIKITTYNPQMIQDLSDSSIFEIIEATRGFSCAKYAEKEIELLEEALSAQHIVDTCELKDSKGRIV